VAYTRERLGDLLMNAGVISEDTLEKALKIQRKKGIKLGEVLINEFDIAEHLIAETLAQQKGIAHVSLESYLIDQKAVGSLPVRFARMQRVIPIDFYNDRLVLAMADPLNIEAIDEVRLMTGFEVEPVVAPGSEIDVAIERHMTSADVFKEMQDDTEETELEESVVSGEEDMPVVRLVNQLIREAVLDGASDIHVEPGKDDVCVRYRVDGVLKEVVRLPKSAHAGITSRIKIMADLDIAERRLPQDGRSSAYVQNKTVDLRIATLPTSYGESVVIRVLHESASLKSLEDLGMSTHNLEVIHKLLARPYGAILAAGPTGSGKTTTLYAALKLIRSPALKIITVEDPIEYRLDGITQMPVQPKIGLTFVRGLRTILRSDPDVVMIGEIRDPETAEIAIRSALTGHLVLSSIHTNDAPSALTRLVDMEVPPFITSSALIGVIAQRLARRLCPECKEPIEYESEVLEHAGFAEEGRASLKPYAPVGCARCAGTGYRGRIGFYEIMVMDEELGKLLMSGMPSEMLREQAISSGMRTLKEDALDKVADGRTSLEEALRIVG